MTTRDTGLDHHFVTALDPCDQLANFTHYARDIVERCDSLIDSLLPVVMRDSGTRFGGPLGTTFLSVFKTYGPRCDKFFKAFPPLS